MTAFSDYLENGLLDHVLRSTDFVAPTSVYVGLVGPYNSGELESGIYSGELSGGSYSRESYPVGASAWIAPTNGVTHNLNTIFFTRATSNWGLVSGLFISDDSALQSGNVLFYGQLSSAVTINSAERFQIPSGSLTIQLD